MHAAMQVLLRSEHKTSAMIKTPLCVETDKIVSVRRAEMVLEHGLGCLRWMVLGWRAGVRMVTIPSSPDPRSRGGMGFGGGEKGH